MFAARPATAGKDLFERLYYFLTGVGEPTAFDLRRLEKDADSLKRADAAQGFTACAAISALKWDLAGAQYWSEQASRVKADQPTLGNAALTLRYINRCDLAADYALRAVECAPLDLGAVDHAVGALAADGRLTVAQDLIDQYERRVGRAVKFGLTPSVFLATCSLANVSERQIQRELRAAMAVLSAERVRHSKITYQHAPEPDGGVMLSVVLSFYGTHDDELRMEAALARALCEMEEWNPCKLSVELEHSSRDVGQPA